MKDDLTKLDMIQVSYNSPTSYGGLTWGSGNTRMERKELGRWILEQTVGGHPLLITEIKSL